MGRRSRTGSIWQVAFVTKVEDVAGAGLTVNLDFGAIKLRTFTQDKIGVVCARKFPME